jgi:hypothetical protein
MPDITISLTDTENKAMEYVAASVQDWADNAVTNRARIAVDEICGLLMTHCNENEIAMAVGKDAQVAQAFELEVVKTAAARNAEADAVAPE